MVRIATARWLNAPLVYQPENSNCGGKARTAARTAAGHAVAARAVPPALPDRTDRFAAAPGAAAEFRPARTAEAPVHRRRVPHVSVLEPAGDQGTGAGHSGGAVGAGSRDARATRAAASSGRQSVGGDLRSVPLQQRALANALGEER